MNHLDAGTIVSVRDHDMEREATAAHLASCPQCAVELEEARARVPRITRALTDLDEPVDLDEAKRAVRRRLDAERGRPADRSWTRRALGRAAALTLLAAGAVSALPGSPLRNWLRPSASEPTSPPVASGASSVGASAVIAVPLARGAISVVVRGAEAGSRVEVRWSGGESATLSAPAGSAFTYAEGRAEVDARPGTIRIDLPSASRTVALTVNGALYLERSGDGVAVTGPIAERTDTSFVFVVTGP